MLSLCNGGHFWPGSTPWLRARRRFLSAHVAEVTARVEAEVRAAGDLPHRACWPRYTAKNVRACQSGACTNQRGPPAYCPPQVRREMQGEAGGGLPLPATSKFDANVITPGTAFMVRAWGWGLD